MNACLFGAYLIKKQSECTRNTCTFKQSLMAGTFLNFKLIILILIEKNEKNFDSFSSYGIG